MAKKRIKLSEKDLSKLIQTKINEIYDDPIQKNKFEFEINQKLGEGIDAFIEGYHQLTEALRLIMMSRNDKRTNSLIKIMDNLYYGIEAIKDMSGEVDPSMGIKGLKENATVDSILDKISRKEPLTNRERMALDMASKGENVDDDFIAKKGLEIKADGNIPFTYTHNRTEQHGENTRFYGTITLDGENVKNNFFTQGSEVKTTVYMSPEDVGEEIPVGSIGVVTSVPKDKEELVGVEINGSLHYLPQDVIEVLNNDEFKFNGYVESTPYGELESYNFVDDNGTNLTEVLGDDLYDINKFGWKIIDELMFNEEN